MLLPNPNPSTAASSPPWTGRFRQPHRPPKKERITAMAAAAREVAGADRRRAAPAIHAARPTFLGPYAAVCFRLEDATPGIQPRPSLHGELFPQAARQFSERVSRAPQPRIPGYAARQRPLTTRALVADYLALCRNPLKDLSRWALEGKKNKGRSPFRTNLWRSAHAQKHPLAWSAETTEYIKTHCKRCLAGWTRAWTNPGGHRLSSRPGTGLPNITYCDRFDPRDTEDLHRSNPMPKDSTG